MLLEVSYFILFGSALSWAFDIDILGTDKDKVDIDLTKIIFDDYLDQFDKIYNTDEEYQNKFKIFVESVMVINKKNIEVGSKMFGLTPFTDMSEEEFQKNVCSFEEKIDDSLKENYTTLAKEYGLGEGAPDSWDWVAQGAVTAVKAQGQCGSCWAFSTTGTIEGQYYIKKKQLMSFSEQQLLDCIDNMSCSAGNDPVAAMNEVICMGGLMTEQDYPYEAKVAQCRLDKSKIAVQVESGTRPTIDENQLTELLHSYGPISIVITITEVFKHYTGGIFDDESCSPSAGTHAILLVGYGTENGKPFWKVKNSWGSTWGESGYGRMIRGKNICGIINYLGKATIVV